MILKRAQYNQLQADIKAASVHRATTSTESRSTATPYIYIAKVTLSTSSSAMSYDQIYVYQADILWTQFGKTDLDVWTTNSTIKAGQTDLLLSNYDLAVHGSDVVYVPCVQRGIYFENITTAPSSLLWNPVITQYVAPVEAAPEADPPVEEVVEVQPSVTFKNCIYLRAPVYKLLTDPTFSLESWPSAGEYYCGVKISVIDGSIDSTLLMSETLSDVVYTTIDAANADADYMRLLICKLKYDSDKMKWSLLLKYISSVPELGLYA
jgi:hypothetical protein